MNTREILRSAKSQLAESGISEVDAEHLLAHVLGLSRMDLHNPVLLESTLLGIEDKDVLEEQFYDLLDRRLNFEPLQYLTGVAGFRYLNIEVGPGVLVPRPESELLVEAVLQHIENLPAPVSVIDLGAGSGALSLAIATEAPTSRGCLAISGQRTHVRFHGFPHPRVTGEFGDLRWRDFLFPQRFAQTFQSNIHTNDATIAKEIGDCLGDTENPDVDTVDGVMLNTGL